MSWHDKFQLYSLRSGEDSSFDIESENLAMMFERLSDISER